MFRSPFVAKLAGEPSGVLNVLPRLRVYFAEALRKYSELRFTGIRALAGVTSITLLNRGVARLHAAEVLVLGAGGRAVRVDAHYAR